MPDFSDDMTLGQARALLRERVEDGHTCPLCTQFAKVYRRNLPSAAARVMIALYRRDPVEYVFLPKVLDGMTGTPHQGGYGTLGHFWGLMEQQPGERDDGSVRTGWWRLTPLGRGFVRCRVRVPRYAHIYNGRCLRFSGPDISIQEALGKKFDYRELMTGG